MGTLYLSVELTVDILTCIVGLILVLKAKDNRPKFYWGCITFLIGLVFSWENIEWLIIVAKEPEYRFTEILNVEKMLKWYPLASIVALFPLASLFPGYLNPFKTLAFLLPMLLLTTVGICYICFNGYMTPLASYEDVLNSLGHTDVVLRCVIFICSIVTPLFFFLYPFLRHRVYRKMNKMMFLFMGFMLLFVCIYILFTLDISYFIFNLFGATAVVFALFFFIQYLFRENPFSVYVVPDPSVNTISGQLEEAVPEPLFLRISDFFQSDHCYANHDYSLKQLAASLHETELHISAAIKSAGFSSFREYINDMRLQYFRQLALSAPEKNIKELIFLSGFNSRATFYRNFSDKFGMSPTQFIDQLRCTE